MSESENGLPNFGSKRTYKDLKRHGDRHDRVEHDSSKRTYKDLKLKLFLRRLSLVHIVRSVPTRI